MVTFFAKSFILDVYTLSEFTSDTEKHFFTMLCCKWLKTADTIKPF